jgi:hypothetical protein
MAIGIKSVHRPAPRWFRIFKKVLNNIINFGIAILLILGYANESTLMLIIKLSQSFIMEQLDTFMSNGEVYATEDTVSVVAVQTASVTTTTPIPEEKKDE